MIGPIHLPSLNALLNAICSVLLVCGLIFIKRKNIPAHRACMIAALITSVLFLTSYLYYHFHAGTTLFPHSGWIRVFYFSLLGSHMFLAAAILPLIIMTVTRAAKGQIEHHKKLARWTWPLWMYVSITGVLVYWMLYRI